MKINLRVDDVEVTDKGILIKEVSILDNSGFVLRKATINQALCGIISERIEAANVLSLMPESNQIYNKLKDKNPLIEKLFEKLDLKIINE